MHVKGPVAALGEFPVADDVDAGLNLLADDLLDRGFQAGLVTRLVIGLAGLDKLEELDQFRRPDQAPDMSGQNAISAGHAEPPMSLYVAVDCSLPKA
jgi:hypothetical protein